jgi:hypothetical protein
VAFLRLGSGLLRFLGFPVRGSPSVSLASVFRLSFSFSGTFRVSQVLDVSLHASHALRGPRQTLGALTYRMYTDRTSALRALSVLASGPLTPSPSAFEAFAPYSLYRGCSIKLGGVRSPLRATWFPVYASIVLFGSFSGIVRSSWPARFLSVSRRVPHLAKPCTARRLSPPPQLQHSVWVDG